MVNNARLVRTCAGQRRPKGHRSSSLWPALRWPPAGWPSPCDPWLQGHPPPSPGSHLGTEETGKQFRFSLVYFIGNLAKIWYCHETTHFLKNISNNNKCNVNDAIKALMIMRKIMTWQAISACNNLLEEVLNRSVKLEMPHSYQLTKLGQVLLQKQYKQKSLSNPSKKSHKTSTYILKNEKNKEEITTGFFTSE